MPLLSIWQREISMIIPDSYMYLTDFFKGFIFSYMYECFASMHACDPCACLVPAKRALSTTELESQVAMNQHVDSQN